MKAINLNILTTQIKEETGADCDVYDGIANDTTLIIPAEHLRKVVDLLMSKFDCQHLSAITAQQREGQEDKVEVIYHFWKGKGLSLLITLPLESPELPSLISIIPGADFYEREVAEMFGVTFTGRKETPPLLLPDDWDQGPPFIRDEENDE